jgi:hypothetical protein
MNRRIAFITCSDLLVLFLNVTCPFGASALELLAPNGLQQAPSGASSIALWQQAGVGSPFLTKTNRRISRMSGQSSQTQASMESIRSAAEVV